MRRLTVRSGPYHTIAFLSSSTTEPAAGAGCCSSARCGGVSGVGGGEQAVSRRPLLACRACSDRNEFGRSGRETGAPCIQSCEATPRSTIIRCSAFTARERGSLDRQQPADITDPVSPQPRCRCCTWTSLCTASRCSLQLRSCFYAHITINANHTSGKQTHATVALLSKGKSRRYSHTVYEYTLMLL